MLFKTFYMNQAGNEKIGEDKGNGFYNRSVKS